jgi:hypothetical protein
MTFGTSRPSTGDATSRSMESPKTNADGVVAAVQARLRRWARCTPWVAGTALILLDCGTHGLVNRIAFDRDMAQPDREWRDVASSAPAPGRIAERDDDLYLPPGLRPGGFE